MTGMNTRWMARALAQVSLGALAVTAMPSQAQAQETRSYNIPAGPLSQALTRFADESGLALVYPASIAEGHTTAGLSGSFNPADALSRLLAGTGLSFRFTGEKTVTIEATTTDGTRVLGAVRVEGAQGSPYFGGAGQAAGVNGVNGSRDITATEGTGSFTSGALTIGSKAPQAMKDVPQSLSVLTSERMEQQNVTDFATALKQLPGITVVQGSSSLESVFYSRGFAISSIQVDGGAPLSTAIASGQAFFPQIDMSIYDHVELLRGAAGLFNGYGDPSGTINLVRKKPLDHAQFSLEAQAGSWSNYRVVADATAPLAMNGKLRGRLVMTYQDRRYFYDTAQDNKTLIYGIAELDATPTTLVTAGLNYTRQDSAPWVGGLPRYQTGGDLKLPRSTSFLAPWSRWDFDTTEIFGGIEQKIANAWNLKLNFTHNRQTSARKLGYNSGAVNPNNMRGVTFTGIYSDFASKQFSAEATLVGAFELFGQRQEVTIGVNRVNSDGGGQTAYAPMIAGTAAAPYQPYPGGPLYYRGSPNGSTPPIDVFNFDPSDPLYTEPRTPLANTFYPVNRQIQSGAYMSLRLTAFDRLHLLTGLRWSRYALKYTSESLCTSTAGNCLGMQIGDAYSTANQSFSDSDISWPPPVSVSFDLTRSLNAYISYADIYSSQANLLDADLNAIEPITGANWEAGFKWAARDGRLNLSVAGYRIKQNGFGISDPNYPPFQEISPGIYCCFFGDKDSRRTSSGIDIEATGELSPGWQIAASYTYSRTRQEGAYADTNDGKPLVSIQPKHLYKLWMSYDFGVRARSGILSGLTLSAGVNGQSSGYQSGSLCVNLTGTPNPTTGAQSCASSEPPDTVEYFFTVPAYAVFSGRLDYRLSPRWSIAVNLENIFDKTYYQTVGSSPAGGNWYGAPRSVIASLRGKW